MNILRLAAEAAKRPVETYRAPAPGEDLSVTRDTVARMGREAGSDTQRIYARCALKAVGDAGLTPESRSAALTTILNVLANASLHQASIAALLAVTAQEARKEVAPGQGLLLGGSFLRMIGEVGGSSDEAVANRALAELDAYANRPFSPDSAREEAHLRDEAAFEVIMNRTEGGAVKGLDGVSPQQAEEQYLFAYNARAHKDKP